MRNCPRCCNTSVIEDGYCGCCRECTLRPDDTETGFDTTIVNGTYLTPITPARPPFHRLTFLLAFVACLGVFLVANYVGYLIFRVNHPGAPWWGFLLD